MKTVTILGSTGSIGTQCLDIVRNNPELFRVNALAAGKNAALMESQIREFHPGLAVLYDEKAAVDLKERVRDLDVAVLSGMDGLLAAAASKEAETVLGGMVGMIGIRPTLEAIREGKDIALANKETLVCAGHLVMKAAGENGVKILPVDSEHSAIFQSLRGGEKKEVEKILLTASGGPFRGKRPEELAGIKPADALKHPNWDMGAKVTIDSSTLANKGLEVMEARWLFDVPIDKIEVVVHPESIVHSAVQFADGAVIAELGIPDMHLPIQYALTYPERIFLGGERLDLFKLGKLTFERPDREAFPALDLALRAAKTGGTMPTVFNAANEEAVSLFLREEISYPMIAEFVAEAMNSHKPRPEPALEEILEAEAEARALVKRRAGKEDR
ncbi:MAG: 1-deoxy-D-xylulose-5-phosphate reductoisomerase [Lachnospiraceae bacterium]|nr:1-deoxy-D-xylulose-5-phosphate reductoisomerase [Lachnospiraceae bacterium]